MMDDDGPTILLSIYYGREGTLMTTTIVDGDGHVTVSARPLHDGELAALTALLATWSD